jgi:transposase-like protein
MGKPKKNKSCPRCGSADVMRLDGDDMEESVFVCMDCDNVFETGWKQRERHKDRHSRYSEEDEFESEVENL